MFVMSTRQKKIRHYLSYDYFIMIFYVICQPAPNFTYIYDDSYGNCFHVQKAQTFFEI